VRVVATAGHVDHGKSTLVFALTGTDPDRWVEEKVRGMTIDLGFAVMTLPSGRDVALVDVPGHYRFLKNMLAGVSSVDACLFVVDAGEGWMAQSEEHLRVLELFGISRGVLALTKVCSVDEDLREFVALDVAEHVKGTFLADAEVVAVDAKDGVGLDTLRAALDRLTDRIPASINRQRARMWIDRSFAMRGTGTVLTGTLCGGSLTVGDVVVIEPGGHRARIRGLQSHYHSFQTADPGRRLAVNLVGVSHHDIGRGHALVQPDRWHLTQTLDASLKVLGTLDHPVERRGAYAVYVGSGEHSARLRVLGGQLDIQPGGTGAVRLWLEGAVPLPLLPGDRYIIRDRGRDQTIGGGQVLDVDPIQPLRRANPTLSVQRVVDERGWVDIAHLERLTGERPTATAGHWLIAPHTQTTIREKILADCRLAGRDGIDIALLGEVERAVLHVGIDGVEVVADRAFDATAVPTTLSAAATDVLARLESHPWTPPDLPLSDRGALRELERRGLACQSDYIWFAASAVKNSVEVLAKLLAESPSGITVSDARKALGTSRKYVLPLLRHLDATGVTRRIGDRRIAGRAMTRRA
jgi:selenocysteine-specific elongation factor